jgi:hypothetical protein
MRGRFMVAATWAVVSVTGCAGVTPADDASLEATLVSLERDSWKAWKTQDASFFESFLSGDHVELASTGVADKAAVVSFISSGACKVGHYVLSDIRFTRISETSAMLVYRVQQDTTCAGRPVPSPTWATSVYTLRDGHWRNILYQQLPETSR